MKQIKLMLIAIVLINSIIKSHQDEQQTLSIPGNITIFLFGPYSHGNLEYKNNYRK